MSIRPPSGPKPRSLLRSVWGLAEVALLPVGALMLASVGAYYAYAAFARAGLEELNYTREAPPLSAPTEIERPSVPTIRQATDTPDVATVVSMKVSPKADSERDESPRAAEKSPPAVEEALPSLPIPSYEGIYPGLQMHPKYWDQPLWAGTAAYTYLASTFPDGFLALEGKEIAPPVGGAATASRIHIPLLEVDSKVAELQILDLKNSRAYETPKNVVGHIPETANPSESGNGWYFGHLESPIRGEGNVFHRLPEIPELLRSGDPVYVIIESADGEFLYEIISTEVVHRSDLKLYDDGKAEITLVTCVPRLIYDHRLVVTAELVGMGG